MRGCAERREAPIDGKNPFFLTKNACKKKKKCKKIWSCQKNVVPLHAFLMYKPVLVRGQK